MDRDRDRNSIFDSDSYRQPDIDCLAELDSDRDRHQFANLDRHGHRDSHPYEFTYNQLQPDDLGDFDPTPLGLHCHGDADASAAL
jgi:hypothetical protein